MRLIRRHRPARQPDAAILRCRTGHEIVYGQYGKTYMVKGMLAQEEASNAVESWIIDPHDGLSLPEWRDRASQYAATPEDGRELLASALDKAYQRMEILAPFAELVPGDERHGLPLLSITIEDAGGLLFPRWELVQIIEDTLPYAWRCGIRYRFVATSPQAFGRSDRLRAVLLDGARHVPASP